MNKQLSVMGLAARASMVPVLIAAGLTALAVGALTYLCLLYTSPSPRDS